MTTASSIRRHYHFSQEMTEEELGQLALALDLVNREADAINAIGRNCGGDQRLGDERMKSSLKRVEEFAKEPLFRGESLVELLTQGKVSELEHLGYKLLQKGEPLAYLQLARCEATRFRGVAAITERVTGSPRAAQGFNPLAPRLCTDGWKRVYLDLTGLDTAATNRKGMWHYYTLMDTVAEVSLQQHYFAERLSLRAVLLAQRFGLEQILRVFGAKVFADYLYYRRKRRRTEGVESDLARQARLYCCPAHPALVQAVEGVSPAAHQRIEKLVSSQVLNPFLEAVSRRVEGGGMLPSRSLESLYLGSRGAVSKGCPPELSELEEVAGLLLPELEETFSWGGKEKKETGVLQVDLADLESRAPMRQLMAAEKISQAFFQFMRESGLEQKYHDELGKEVDSAPLPKMDPAFPIDYRLLAAVTARLFNDFKGVLSLPSWVAVYNPHPALSEEENKVFRTMWEELIAVANRRIAFKHLQGDERVDRLIEGWLALHEARFPYFGCGVSSVSALLFPAFFFGDARFAELIAPEGEWFQACWHNIRELAAPLGEAVGKREWGRVHDILRRVMHELKQLHLQSTAPDFSPSGGLPLPPVVDPFANPPVIDKSAGDIETLAGVAAPIRTCKAPPGDPQKYLALLARKQHLIRLLKRLDSHATAPRTALRRHTKCGPVIDDVNLPDYRHSEHIFSTVRYDPAPVPHGREQVVILFDFSGSMGAEKVAAAKDAAVVIAEGLRDKFDVKLLLYNNPQQFYDLTTVYDSADRKVAGNAALASICSSGLNSGDGANPDAGIILGVVEFNKRSGNHPFILIHLSDHEWCPSLSIAGVSGVAQEMRYAVERLLGEGHRYVAARVGKDEDPIAAMELPHEYIYFGNGGLDEGKVRELYRVLVRCGGS